MSKIDLGLTFLDLFYNLKYKRKALNYFMPTIRQLIKKGRKKIIKRHKTPALTFSFNVLKNRPKKHFSPFKRNSTIFSLVSSDSAFKILSDFSIFTY